MNTRDRYDWQKSMFNARNMRKRFDVNETEDDE